VNQRRCHGPKELGTQQPPNSQADYTVGYPTTSQGLPNPSRRATQRGHDCDRQGGAGSRIALLGTRDCITSARDQRRIAGRFLHQAEVAGR
jgi:hypothetical protein